VDPRIEKQTPEQEHDRATEQSCRERPRRFQLVKLEERIAPRGSGTGYTRGCYPHWSRNCW